MKLAWQWLVAVALEGARRRYNDSSILTPTYSRKITSSYIKLETATAISISAYPELKLARLVMQ